MKKNLKKLCIAICIVLIDKNEARHGLKAGVLREVEQKRDPR
jgi:hypothetical protein